MIERHLFKNKKITFYDNFQIVSSLDPRAWGHVSMSLHADFYVHLNECIVCINEL